MALSSRKVQITIGLVLLLGVYGLASVMSAQNPVERKAIVVNVNGIVDVKKAGATQWVPAVQGMKLANGDTLRTTIDSVMDILLDEGSTLRLAEETTMTIDELASSNQKARFLYFFNRPVEAQVSKLKLEQGKVMAGVKKLPTSQSQFRVETPKGVAGVRGTSWYVGEEDVGVPEGFIDWKGKRAGEGGANSLMEFIENLISGGKPTQGEVHANWERLNEGFAATINPDTGNLQNPIVVPDQERERVVEAYRETFVAIITAPPETRQAINSVAPTVAELPSIQIPVAPAAVTGPAPAAAAAVSAAVSAAPTAPTAAPVTAAVQAAAETAVKMAIEQATQAATTAASDLTQAALTTATQTAQQTYVAETAVPAQTTGQSSSTGGSSSTAQQTSTQGGSS